MSLVDAMPAGLTLTAAQLAVSTGSLSFATSATSLTVGTASFAAGATATITVTVLVGAGTGSITNVVGITTTTADPVTTNNTSTSTISRIDNADLQVTKTTSISGGTVGATFSYVITFANAGPSAAANATLTDAVSSNLTVVSATVSVSVGSVGFATSGNNLNLTTASFAAGATGSITLTVVVSGAGGSITNLVSITSTTPDPVPTNNKNGRASRRVRM